jgi:HPt (histidine-containing phosphotransfer) domain-containing protein
MAENQVIIPYLVAYFDRAERAKRYTMPGFIARELASYHVLQQKKLAGELITESIKLQAIKKIQRQVKRLVKQAESLQGDELRQVGAQIEKLQEQAESWLNS